MSGAEDGHYSRRVLLGRAVATAGLAGVGLDALWRAAEPEPALAAARAGDEDILSFLLGLERLQVAFFTQALQGGRLGPELRQFARTVVEQDTDHEERLKSLLGAGGHTLQVHAEPVRGAAAFRRAAVTLKEAVLAAYVGEGANLSAGRITPVASIVSVEARHAAWIRAIAGTTPAPRAADAAAPPRVVTAKIRRAGIGEVR